MRGYTLKTESVVSLAFRLNSSLLIVPTCPKGLS
jgi:hypothetical protein